MASSVRNRGALRVSAFDIATMEWDCEQSRGFDDLRDATGKSEERL